jgi:hypothetical protein
MTSLGFVSFHGPLENDIDAVRKTTAEVPDRAATNDDAPEFNSFNGSTAQESGLATHQAASSLRDSEHGSPVGMELATQDHGYLDNQWAQKGTAAQRESGGRYGHGSMAITVGIEPTIRDGAAMGNDYFTAHDKSIQETAGNEVGAIPGDRGISALAQAFAVKASREASQRSMYAQAFGPGGIA